jgi:hypothetical protein
MHVLIQEAFVDSGISRPYWIERSPSPAHEQRHG